MAKRLVLDFSDELYQRIENQLQVKKPEYAKAWIFDNIGKMLNNIEARKNKGKS